MFVIFICIASLALLASCSLKESYFEEDDGASLVGDEVTPTTPDYPVQEVRREYHPDGSYVTMGSVDSLTFRAADVVRAEVIDSRTERISMLRRQEGDMLCEEEIMQLARIHTIYRLKVLEVFLGDAAIGDVIEVMQAGGRLGDVEYINVRLQYLSYGDEYVFFLRNFDAIGLGHLPMALAGGEQSVYRVAPSLSNGIVAAYDANPGIEGMVFESIISWNEIVLTVWDLILIRYEAGLGPRPHNLQLPVGIDRGQLNIDIARAEYYLPVNYMLAGWDRVQDLLDIAIDVRDNPYSRQIHVNPASRRLRHEMFVLGIDTYAPLPTPPPPPPPPPPS